MKAAVFSSSPIPIANGLKASAVSSRPSRSRWRKCWSMMTRLVRPRPGARVTILARGEPPFLAERDHVLAEERGPGRRAGDVDALRVPPPERLGDRGAADHRAEPELVAAGEEDRRPPASRTVEPLRRSQSARLCDGERRAPPSRPARGTAPRSGAPVSLTSDAVGMMAIRPVPVPQSDANRRRMATSPIFSSAPPTGMMNPRLFLHPLPPMTVGGRGK